MYDSPVTRVVSDICHKMEEQEDGKLTYTISQAVGYSVDKPELIKALNYDRDQYKKGYEDAMAVLDTIKAEINEKISHYDHFSSSNTAHGLEMAIEIIDNHISGKDGE